MASRPTPGWVLGVGAALSLGVALTLLTFSAGVPPGVLWLLPALALLGAALMLAGGAWALWEGVARLRRGGGWSGLVTWAGLAWLTLPLVLLGYAAWLTRSGDFGFSVSGAGVGWTVYYPSDLAEQRRTVAGLLALWLGPGLALLWWGRRLRRRLEGSALRIRKRLQ